MVLEGGELIELKLCRVGRRRLMLLYLVGLLAWRQSCLHGQTTTSRNLRLVDKLFDIAQILGRL